MLNRAVLRVLGLIAAAAERFRVWHLWPFIPSIAIIIGLRDNLRRNNLFAQRGADLTPNAPDAFDTHGWRAPDGAFNDPDAPSMGMTNMPFGRNIPLDHSFGETPPHLYHPNPREISNKILARKTFVPVPYLNVLAAAWIQFMVHDWLTHGKNDPTRVHHFPLPDGDDWPLAPGTTEMRVLATQTPDTSGSPVDASVSNRPSAYVNKATHWWDGSQIYGSDLQKCERLRVARSADGTPGARLEDGKLWLDAEGLLPIDEQSAHTDPRDPDNLRHELTGENGNWWIGLSVLHTLFAREHNAIVDRLTLEYPGQSREWLFQKARLVNAALLAKIHTVEWTPALMNSPTGRMLMRGNYWGLTGEQFTNSKPERQATSEVVGGIPGTPQDHHDVPFAMTEEFTSAYRMHPLMPDVFSFRHHGTDAEKLELGLTAVAMGRARGLYDHMPFEDVLYSLATENPGALTLHNYPNSLRRLDKKRSENIFIDLAAVDILRDRERGVPRFREFRRLIGAKPPESIDDITDDPDMRASLKSVYAHVDEVDLMTGILAESKSKTGTPDGFGFSDTAFRIFIVMASRRIKSDRFFTDDFTPEVYTPAGFQWVRDNGFSSVVKRHCPVLAPHLADVRNPFFPWKRGGTA